MFTLAVAGCSSGPKADLGLSGEPDFAVFSILNIHYSDSPPTKTETAIDESVHTQPKPGTPVPSRWYCPPPPPPPKRCP